MLPLPSINFAGIASLTLTLTRFVMGLGWRVTSFATIAFEFTQNAAAVALEFCSNRANCNALAAQCVNLVSFFPAQVCVGQRASHGLVGLKSRSYVLLTHPVNS